MYSFRLSEKLRSCSKVINTAISSSAITLIAFFCLLLSICTLLTYGRSIVSDISTIGIKKSATYSIFAVALFFLVLLKFCRRNKTINPKIFLPGIILVYMIVQVLYAIFVQVVWISDFQHMWQITGTLLREGRFLPNDIYEQRVLPILLPLVYIFGNNPILIPISNSVFLISILLIGYDILRKTHGHFSAQIFSLLWVACAEPIFSLKIPTHDLWGLFFCVLIVWVVNFYFCREQKTFLGGMGYGLIAGLLIIALEVQREIGGVVIVAWSTSLLILSFRKACNPPQRTNALNSSLWVMLITATFIFFAGTSTLKSAKIMVTSPSYTYLSNLRIAALAPSYSDGTYNYAHTFGNAFFKGLSPDAQKEGAGALFLSDSLEQPGMRMFGLLFKTNVLSPLGSQHYFYQNNLENVSPLIFENIVLYNKIFSLLFVGFFCFSLVIALQRNEDLLVNFSFSFLGIMIGGLVTIGEVQARYMLPFWFFASIIISTKLSNPDLEKTFSIDLERTILVGGGTILILGISIWWITDRIYNSPDGRVLSSFTFEGSKDAQTAHIAPVQIDRAVYNGRSLGVGRLGFTLNAKNPTVEAIKISAEKKICLNEKTSLRFGYIMPYNNPLAKNAFLLGVRFDGKEIWSRHLPDDGGFHNIKIENIGAPLTCGIIEYFLESKDPLFDNSWVQASRTEIYFPRLAKY